MNIKKFKLSDTIIVNDAGTGPNMSIYGYNYENYYRSGREDKYDRIEPKLIDKFFSGDFGKLSGKSLEKSKRNFENEEGDMLGIYDINGDSDDDIIIYYKSDSDILYILSREDFSYPENAWSMGEEYYRTHNRYVSEEEREDDKARVAQLKKEYEEEKAKKEAKGEEFKEYDVEKKYYESKYIAPVKYTEPGNVLLPIQKEEIRNWYPEKPKGLHIPSNTEITKLAQEQAKKEIMEQLQAGEFGDPKKIDKTKIKELLEGRFEEIFAEKSREATLEKDKYGAKALVAHEYGVVNPSEIASTLKTIETSYPDQVEKLKEVAKKFNVEYEDVVELVAEQYKLKRKNVLNSIETVLRAANNPRFKYFFGDTKKNRFKNNRRNQPLNSKIGSPVFDSKNMKKNKKPLWLDCELVENIIDRYNLSTIDEVNEKLIELGSTDSDINVIYLMDCINRNEYINKKLK